MKSKKVLIGGALAVSLLVAAACGYNGDEATLPDEPTLAVSGMPTGSGAPAESDRVLGGAEGDAATHLASDEFSFSEGMDENGFWLGINALDYVDLFDYQAMHIPANVHHVSDADVQGIIEGLLQEYSTATQVTNRPVAEGDLVNMDFVGSVDGVEFDGGSTGGMGMDVPIEHGQFIDGFLEQLIGHMPGDVVYVEVTFPEFYPQSPDLEGAEALFITTINHIVDSVVPELTDAFVQETFAHIDESLNSVAALREDIWGHLQNGAVMEYIDGYLRNHVNVQAIPPAVLSYFEQEMMQEYVQQAWQFGMEVDELISLFGFESVEAFMEIMRPEIESSARRSLVLQAIAQDAGIVVGVQEITDFFVENLGTDDFSMFEEFHGLPWLKQTIRNEIVLDLIKDNAVFA